jgi:hypothetical protein
MSVRAILLAMTAELKAPVGEFNLSRLEKVIYGPGKVAALKDEIGAAGTQAGSGGDHRSRCGEIGETVKPIKHELDHLGVVDRPLSEQEILALLESCY